MFSKNNKNGGNEFYHTKGPPSRHHQRLDYTLAVVVIVIVRRISCMCVLVRVYLCILVSMCVCMCRKFECVLESLYDRNNVVAFFGFFFSIIFNFLFLFLCDITTSGLYIGTYDPPDVKELFEYLKIFTLSTFLFFYFLFFALLYIHKFTVWGTYPRHRRAVYTIIIYTHTTRAPEHIKKETFNSKIMQLQRLRCDSYTYIIYFINI